MTRVSLLQRIAAVTLTVALAPCLFAQQDEGPLPTAAVVHIDSKRTPVEASMLTLQVNGHPEPITSLLPVDNRGVDLAILIDDGLRTRVALQLSDIQNFIQGLPPSVRVLVGYMQNGRVAGASKGFMADHAEIAKDLRMPIAIPGVSASPYICLSDFVQHWPSQDKRARVVLMITDGVDPYNGSVSPLNQDSPYVENAGRDAMKAGVVVYALYYADAGIRGGLANFSGQSYLAQITETTGGESLYQGTITPVSFEPYLKELSKDLSESYLLGFEAVPRRKADTVNIKVKSHVSGVKVRAPDSVLPGNDQ